MGLFDDLLKKPTVNTGSASGTGDDSSSGSTGTNPPVSDPLSTTVPEPISVIQKTEEVSIVTEAPAETAAAMPPPVTVSAVEDTSSIIIGANPIPTPSTTTEANPIIVTSPETSIFSNVEVTPAMSSSNPVQEVHDIGIISAPVEEPIKVKEDIESTSLMDLIGGSDEVIVETKPMETDPVAILSTDSTVAETVPGETLAETTVTEESTNNITESLTETVQTVESPLLELTSDLPQTKSSIDTVETYEHPTEFIEASIARIDTMIARIDEIHNAKLSEALGYKAEKEKYTALEEQAYTDAEKYVTEKDHALSMRNYFVDQGKAAGVKTEGKTPEPVASVETTLTGLAVQNAVSETVKHEKKSKAKKEEQEVLGL